MCLVGVVILDQGLESLDLTLPMQGYFNNGRAGIESIQFTALNKLLSSWSLHIPHTHMLILSLVLCQRWIF